MTPGVTPHVPGDVLDLSASDLAAQVRSGHLSPNTIAHAVCDRLSATEPDLHAFISFNAPDLLDQARALQEQAGAHEGPLYGIPVAIKDNIDVRGVATTAGTSFMDHYIACDDASGVARLRRSGALLVGRTNLHEFA